MAQQRRRISKWAGATGMTLLSFPPELGKAFENQPFLLYVGRMAEFLHRKGLKNIFADIQKGGLCRLAVFPNESKQFRLIAFHPKDPRGLVHVLGHPIFKGDDKVGNYYPALVTLSIGELVNNPNWLFLSGQVPQPSIETTPTAKATG